MSIKPILVIHTGDDARTEGPTKQVCHKSEIPENTPSDKVSLKLDFSKMPSYSLYDKMDTVSPMMADAPATFLQVFAHAIYPWTPVIGLGLFIVLFCFKYTSSLMIVYGVYIIFDKTKDRGARPSEWLRNISFWQWYADYFPCRLLKEQDLDPKGNYVFGYHPHGILAVGAYANFCSNATNFSGLFPGINLRMLTVNGNFVFPFYRELALWMGMASCSKESFQHILSQGPGNSCLIAVGGTAETLLAGPGRADLVLKKRYGFVVQAIKAGASLVPVYNFGENYMARQYEPKRGSLFYRFQRFSKRITGMTLPLFYGRGFTVDSSGILPYNVHMVTVVGAPISVEKNVNPSQEYVQEIHTKYIEELSALYERHIDDYHPHEFGPAPKLNFVDA